MTAGAAGGGDPGPAATASAAGGGDAGPAATAGAAAESAETAETAQTAQTVETAQTAETVEIERCITALVRAAPDLDLAVAAALVERLREVGSPLALSIARIVELVAEGLVAQGIALPHLAMACATLADGVAGRLTQRELEAARYEIDTLQPMPDPPGARPPIITVPDVPASALTRGPRRRT